MLEALFFYHSYGDGVARELIFRGVFLEALEVYKGKKWGRRCKIMNRMNKGGLRKSRGIQ